MRTRPMPWLMPLLLTALALSGCAVMTPEQCREADWGRLGLQDGQQGASLSLISRRIDACAQAGVSIGVPQYLQGREVGLQSYCRLDLAAQRGLAGETYNDVCPPELDPEFRRRFGAGRSVYDARLNLGSVRHAINQADKAAREAPTEEARHKTRLQRIELEYELRRALDALYDSQRQLDLLGPVR